MDIANKLFMTSILTFFPPSWQMAAGASFVVLRCDDCLCLACTVDWLLPAGHADCCAV